MAVTPAPVMSAVLRALGREGLSNPTQRAAMEGAGRAALRQIKTGDDPKPAGERLRARLQSACQRSDWSTGKALRLLVEAALLNEMGETLQLDPEFATLIERTSTALESDESCAGLIREAFEQLTALGRLASVD